VDWLKLNSRGILRGSLSSSDNVTQLVWIKLLAMANETRDRDGYLRFKEGSPYTLGYIATTCGVSQNELEIAIDDFMDDVRDGVPRVEYAPDGSLKLNNWRYYQSKPIIENAAPRLRGAIEKEAITRRLVSGKPEIAVDVLTNDYGMHVVDVQGEEADGK